MTVEEQAKQIAEIRAKIAAHDKVQADREERERNAPDENDPYHIVREWQEESSRLYERERDNEWPYDYDEMENYRMLLALIDAGSRRVISKSELETMAKALCNRHFGEDVWNELDAANKSGWFSSAKAACTSVGFEVEE